MLIVAGCANRESRTLYVVETRIVIDGEPAANVNLALHPVQLSSNHAVCPVGFSDVNGFCQFSTVTKNDGVATGRYVVTMLWPDDDHEPDECEAHSVIEIDRLRGRYASPITSPISIIVQPTKNVFTLIFSTSDDSIPDRIEVKMFQHDLPAKHHL